MVYVVILILVNLVCAYINAYCFMLAKSKPDIYPAWYKYMTGIFTVYCSSIVGVGTAIAVIRLL